MPRSWQRRTIWSSDVVGSGREGEDHVLDVALGDHVLEVPARAEHGQLARARPRSRAGRCRGSRPAASPNSGRCIRRRATRLPIRPAPTISVVLPRAVADRAGPHVEERGPAGGQAANRNKPEQRRLSREVDVVREGDPDRDHAHRGDRGRGDDHAGLVEEVRAEPGAVEAAQPEPADHQDEEERIPDDGRKRACRPRSRRRGWRPTRRRASRHRGRRARSARASARRTQRARHGSPEAARDVVAAVQSSVWRPFPCSGESLTSSPTGGANAHGVPPLRRCRRWKLALLCGRFSPTLVIRGSPLGACEFGNPPRRSRPAAAAGRTGPPATTAKTMKRVPCLSAVQTSVCFRTCGSARPL